MTHYSLMQNTYPSIYTYQQEPVQQSYFEVPQMSSSFDYQPQFMCNNESYFNDNLPQNGCSYYSSPDILDLDKQQYETPMTNQDYDQVSLYSTEQPFPIDQISDWEEEEEEDQLGVESQKSSRAQSPSTKGGVRKPRKARQTKLITDEKELEKLKNNRIAVQKCRQKKLDKISQLEQELEKQQQREVKLRCLLKKIQLETTQLRKAMNNN